MKITEKQAKMILVIFDAYDMPLSKEVKLFSLLILNAFPDLKLKSNWNSIYTKTTGKKSIDLMLLKDQAQLILEIFSNFDLGLTDSQKLFCLLILNAFPDLRNVDSYILWDVFETQ